jgi:flagellar FliL protein
MKLLQNKKLLLMVGVPVLVIALLGGAFVALNQTGGPMVVKVSLGGDTAHAQAADPATDVAGSPAVEATPTPIVPRPDPESVPPGAGIMIDLGSKVINLADPGGYRYLRVGLVLEFAPPTLTYYTAKDEEKQKEAQALKDEVTAQRAIIDDTVIGMLSNEAFADIFTLQGKESLKQDLVKTINDKLEGLQVLRVYFTDFLVQ